VRSNGPIAGANLSLLASSGVSIAPPVEVLELILNISVGSDVRRVKERVYLVSELVSRRVTIKSFYLVISNR
jgi:hypothetical protein